MKKEIMIEQRAVVDLADTGKRKTRMTFFVTLDFNSLCDNIEYWYGKKGEILIPPLLFSKVL